MASNDFTAESPENFEQKSICCFVVDVSGSMSGSPINQLNKGLQEFYTEIQNDSTTSNRLEIAIVEFSSIIDTIVQPSLIENFQMPTLTTKGSTKLVDGVREAISLVEARKDWYKSTQQPYLRPWIILITDGEPDYDQDNDALALEIESATKDKKFVFLSLGVENANMTFLEKIAGYKQDDDNNWVKIPPMKLQGLKFSEFFKWVSASMSIVAGSMDGDKINLPDPSDWMDGFSI